MTVLYFGVYNQDYARNWVLINGLRANGVEVFELRRKPEHFSLFRLFFDYLKFKEKYDVMIVGFPGQEVMFLARWLTFKPIIFDVFTSHYGGYILDRQKFLKNSFHAKHYRFLDKWSCKLADVVLLDTNAHINFFVKEFNLPREKFKRIWAGANDDIFNPFDDAPTFAKASAGRQGKPVSEHNDSSSFKVFFFGTYIPLQGVEYILKAAKILEHAREIDFTLVGDGQERKKAEELAIKLGLKNVVFKGMMKSEELKEEIANCDVSLGIFGSSPKTSLVIPNKVYIGLAMKKPVITADTEAVRELFDDEDMILISSSSESALAEAILKIKNNPALGEKIAQNGYDKFIKSASHKTLGHELKNIINDTRNSLSR
ncbi:MAG: group 1 glycosyl transferase [Microgenomates group bacterium Gr01-1014_93]|nr:MAG: group 1 glycosyl transferase [Microgenomates group bacterium Gr01-1014_93]